MYNFTLKKKMDYYEENKKSISIYELRKELRELKRLYPNYTKVSSGCLYAMFFRVENAYKLFFTKHNHFPKFKRRGQFVSQEYQKERIKVIDEHRFMIPSGGSNKNFIVRTSEPIPKDFRTTTINKKSDGWYVNFIVDVEEKEYKDNGKILSIDLGIKTLVTGYSTETNEYVEIPKFSHHTKHLDIIRSQRDKCTKGSRRYRKLSKVLHGNTAKYIKRTEDYLHKSSKWIMNRNESNIIIGNLNLQTMKSEKTWFNRIILNEWRVGKFVDMLEYKSKLYGKKLIKIDESYTTKTCPKCGVLHDMKLSQRAFVCECGYSNGRDRNSSINILRKYCEVLAIDYKDKFSIFNELATARNLNIREYKYV